MQGSTEAESCYFVLREQGELPTTHKRQFPLSEPK